MPMQRAGCSAIDAEATVDAGAYSAYPFSACLEAAQVASILPGPYLMDAFQCRTWSIASNKPPILPFRGVARPGVCFALELVIDAIAREVGREPHEVRLDSLIGPERMPFDNITAKHYDSGDYPESIRRTAEAIDVAGVRARQAPGEPDGRRVGRRLLDLLRAGRARHRGLFGLGHPDDPGLRAGDGAADAGRRAGAPRRRPQPRPGAGDHPRPGGARGPRHRHRRRAGGAGRYRLHPLLDRHLGLALHDHGGRGLGRGLQAARRAHPADRRWAAAGRSGIGAAGGRTGSAGPSGSVTLQEVGRTWYLRPQDLTDDVDRQGLEVIGGYKPERDSGTFSYACHAAVVAVDTATGEVEIVDYVVVRGRRAFWSTR